MQKQEIDLIKAVKASKHQELEVMTQSSVKCYQLCPRKYQNRYIKGIIPDKPEADALRIGTNWHKLLELLKLGNAEDYIREYLEKQYEARNLDESRKMVQEYCRLTAMFVFYVSKYKKQDEEDFQVISVEEVINEPLTNPSTGRKSRSFRFNGKVDGVWKTKRDIDQIPEGTIFLAEHKSASNASPGYMKTKAGMDLQTSLYCYHLGLSFCLYDVMVKPSIKLRQKDTESDYIARILDWYADKEEEKVFRLWLNIDQEKKRRARLSLWSTSKKILSDKNDDHFMQFSESCEKWNRFCDYYALCESGDNPIIEEQLFRKKKAHSELDDQPDMNDPLA